MRGAQVQNAQVPLTIPGLATMQHMTTRLVACQSHLGAVDVCAGAPNPVDHPPGCQAMISRMVEIVLKIPKIPKIPKTDDEGLFIPVESKILQRGPQVRIDAVIPCSARVIRETV